jgi:hypothetical protein
VQALPSALHAWQSFSLAMHIGVAVDVTHRLLKLPLPAGAVPAGHVSSHTPLSVRNLPFLHMAQALLSALHAWQSRCLATHAGA